MYLNISVKSFTRIYFIWTHAYNALQQNTSSISSLLSIIEVILFNTALKTTVILRKISYYGSLKHSCNTLEWLRKSIAKNSIKPQSFQYILSNFYYLNYCLLLSGNGNQWLCHTAAHWRSNIFNNLKKKLL